MNLWFALAIQFAWILIPLGLLAVGGIGYLLDAEHRRDLAYRRAELGHVMVVDLKRPPGMDARYGCRLVTGEVVLSANRLLTFFAKFKLFFGGEVKGYHGLMTRARQEATLRLMAQAASMGYDAIANVRFEAADIAGVTTASAQQRGRQGVYVGILAYGTAYRRLDGTYPPPAPPQLEGYLA